MSVGSENVGREIERDAERSAIAAELGACRADPARFNETILSRPAYWSRQEEICESVVAFRETDVVAGNSVGKSFVDAGLLIWFLLSFPGSMVLCTAPSQTQLEEVLWKQVERAYNGARVPIGGRMLKDPLKLDLGDGWEALAYSTTRTERLSGHHRGAMLVIVDEASGVETPIFEALDSCNPSRLLLTGNPLRPDGVFYERCASAEAAKGKPDRLANLIRIPSTESPDIDLERSPRGLADATWLRKSANDYGEDSLWWKSHVLALFPDQASDQVISRAWLDLAAAAAHVPSGPRRIAIDLGEGNGGDRSVVLCRDDNGMLDLRHSPNWSFERTAKEAADCARKHKVDPRRVSFDAGGPGADFANRLEAAGVHGARAYRGGNTGATDGKYANLRTAAAWLMRQRLDPRHKIQTAAGDWITRPQFSIRPDWASLLRPELQALRYSQDARGRIELERKEDLVKRLKHSPDFADAFAQSFAFPNS